MSLGPPKLKIEDLLRNFLVPGAWTSKSKILTSWDMAQDVKSFEFDVFWIQKIRIQSF